MPVKTMNIWMLNVRMYGGDCLPEEVDEHANPFDQAYSWNKHVQPFEGKMSDVIVGLPPPTGVSARCRTRRRPSRSTPAGMASEPWAGSSTTRWSLT